MEKSTGRKTRQLEVVWHEVAGDNSHPTADQIYQRVRSHIPNISLGTVYRDLHKLVAEGKLQVLTLGRTQHFDPLLDSTSTSFARPADGCMTSWSVRAKRSCPPPCSRVVSP
jgi:Fe2+ or Zn2+ uptake regulation protein